MRQLLSRLLQIRREERGLILLALAFAFASVAQTAVIRILSDAILLTEFDASYLPGFFIGSSLAFMVASVAYAFGLGRGSSAGLNAWLLAGLALFALVARPLYPILGPVFVFALCLVLTVAAPLVRIMCWNAITECVDVRQAKRLLPLAAAGSTLGAIAAGVLAAPFISARGTDDLLYVVAFLFAAMAPIPRLLAQKAIAPSGVAARESAAPEGYFRATALGIATIRRNRLVGTVAGMLFLGAIVTCLLDYSLKTALQERFSKDEIAIFLGHYWALVNALILVLQLLVVGRVLLSFGVRFVFVLLPAALLTGSVFMAIDPIFPAIVGITFMDLVLRYTFQNAATEMVLTPVPTLERNRAKVVIKGVTVPLGALLAGVLLLPMRELWSDAVDGWRAIAWLSLGLLGLWLLLVLRVKETFVAELQSALGFGQVVLSPTPDARAVLEADGVRSLVGKLEHRRPEELRFSIELLATGLQKIPQVRRLLADPHPRVRATALRAIGEHRLTRHRRRVLALLDGEREPEVVAAALAALRRLAMARSVTVAARFVASEDVRVRAEALALLHHAGSAPDRALARATVEQWITGSALEREMAAYLIGEMNPVAASAGNGEDLAPWDLAALGDLLSDHEQRVRVAAYAAVGRARVRVYLPRLVQALSVREEARLAAPALRQFGAAAVPALMRAYRGRGCPRRLMLRIVQALGSLEVTDAVFALTDLLRDSDAEVRRLAIRSLHRLKRTVTPRAFLPARFAEAMLREVRLGHLCFGLIAEMHATHDEFFVDEVHRRLRGTAERIFDLLGLMHDARVMRALHRRYRRGPAAVRANTLEFLENVVEPDLRRPILRLLEDAPLAERAARARVAWALSERGRFAATLLDAADDRWLQRCLLYVSGPELRRRYPPREREVEEMVPILERVILMKSVPLFSELSGESLYPIAEIAEEVQVPQGTVIFEEGDLGNYLYIVVRGEIEILKGAEVVARRLSRDAFGEMALIDDRPRSATAVAREDSELLRIASEPFGDLLDQNPEISRGIIKVLLTYVRGEEGPPPL